MRRKPEGADTTPGDRLRTNGYHGASETHGTTIVPLPRHSNKWRSTRPTSANGGNSQLSTPTPSHPTANASTTDAPGQK